MADDTTPVEAMPADADAKGNAFAQEVADTETEQGYRGTKVDPTPNESYTLQGVVSGALTPETDPANFNR